MHVPAYIRFTLAELTAFGLQSAEVLARANSAIHLVLTEQQQLLTSLKMQAACSIISVEDADGITVAVLKHPEGKAWDRRHEAVIYTPEVTGTVSLDVPGRDPNYVAKGVRSEPEPVVPRREPPHAAPAGEDRFQRGVDAMACHIKQQFDLGGPIRKIEFQYGLYSRGADMAQIDGQISLRTLGKAFLDAYGPQITISDQVRATLAKRAMKLLLLKWRSDGSIHFLGDYEDDTADGDDQVARWGDHQTIEGTIDIDGLVKACWSEMKEGEGR